MRSEPGTKTEVIGKLPKGTEVTYTGRITEEKDGHVWAEVSYDGKTGWVATEYLEEIVGKESVNEQNGEQANGVEENTIKITGLDENGLNMIANIERNVKQIVVDDKGNIVSVPIIGNDVGYGFDISVNKLPEDYSSSDLTSEQAYELLKITAEEFSLAIAKEFDVTLSQDQFNALVLLKYNIGYLSNIKGFMEYIENGKYNRDEMRTMINNYYDLIISRNPKNEKYRNGWYNRTEAMLDIFFDGNYGNMPIDVVNGKVKK